MSREKNTFKIKIIFCVILSFLYFSLKEFIAGYYQYLRLKNQKIREMRERERDITIKKIFF